jgi:hypothetical protein
MEPSTKEEIMYRVTVEGEVKTWVTLEYAMADVFSRGFGKFWTLESIPGE